MAVAQTLFPPASLKRALERLGFVQADPIRAPARAQDLILRHRVKGYRAGDLERRYETLGIAEDFFINYGFVTHAVQNLMHPRRRAAREMAPPRPGRRPSRAQQLLEFVREQGAVHPREVDAHFSHGRVTNYWGGSSNATTHLLDALHYQGLLRVVRRDKGIRVYAVHQHEAGPTDKAARHACIDALVDAAVSIYAPLPGRSLSYIVRRFRLGTPQWRTELTAALQRAKHRLAQVRLEGVDWYWPAEAPRLSSRADDIVRLLTPFDPVVWDRDRFELLWNWQYRFEAYTPASKRKLGYYALPLLWRDRVIGWGNLAVHKGELRAEFGYVGAKPREPAFQRELDLELDRMRLFLRLEA